MKPQTEVKPQGGSMNYFDADLNNLKPCHECHILPTLSRDGDTFFLECPKHGHMASGDSVAEAKKNWNHYITVVLKVA